MSGHTDTIRNALYAAVQPPNVKLAPVPGTPIGDAHLALDALLAENQRLREAIDRAATDLEAWELPPRGVIATALRLRKALAGDAE